MKLIFKRWIISQFLLFPQFPYFCAMKNFIEELKWRGMLHDSIPGTEEYLAQGMATAYIGFDPTAASMTLGNYVQVMLLSLLQRCGHKPVALLGGATGRIGDPSGKSQERQLKPVEETDANVRKFEAQMRKFLDFENGDNKAILVNNLDFYKDMNVLDFLRNVGKTLTVNYMMSKDSVQNRLESGLSFTEFSYQLLQAYDFLCLYERFDCKIQMGGSDQWGNITSGNEFIRRHLGEKSFAITTPLLTKANGEKFGKSESGNIWLDREMTTPYQFYQFWINADDKDVSKLMRYFSFKTREEIEGLEAEFEAQPQRLKQILAEELTIRVHSQEDFDSALRVSGLLFNPKFDETALQHLTAEELADVAVEITAFEVPAAKIQEGIGIADLLTELAAVFQSKGDVRRAIQSNALAINKVKVSTHELMIGSEALLKRHYIFIENGKKLKYMIHAS